MGREGSSRGYAPGVERTYPSTMLRAVETRAGRFGTIWILDRDGVWFAMHCIPKAVVLRMQKKRAVKTTTPRGRSREGVVLFAERRLDDASNLGRDERGYISPVSTFSPKFTVLPVRETPESSLFMISG